MLKKVLRIVFAVLLVCWMIVIFRFSAQTATESRSTSAGFIQTVISFFYPKFEKLSVADQQHIYSLITTPIRKLAHFTLYFIMGVISFFTFYTYEKIRIILRALISFGVCALYAVSDELHQLFVPGRGCEIRDMLIDSSGALLSICILLLICRFIRLGKKRKEE